MDYAGNSNKDKEPKQERPEKNVEKIVAGEVTVVKRSLGRKFKDFLSEADFRSVFSYVVHDVLLPSAKNMIVDAAGRGVERAVYGEASIRRRGYPTGPGYSRISYNEPVRRDYRSAPPSRAPGGIVHGGPRRQSQDDIILADRSEAERVVETMNAIVDQYQAVTLADLKDMLGLPAPHTDNKWGWTFVGNVPIRQVREGYLIDLPPAEHLQ